MMNQYTGIPTEDIYVGYKNIRDLIDFTVEAYPTTTAYVFRPGKGKNKDLVEERSYAQFRADLRAYAAGLLSKVNLPLTPKFAEKEHIAVIGATSYAWSLVHNATLCGLGVSVPLDKQLAEDEVSSLCTRGKVNLFAFDYSHLSSAQKTMEDNPQIHTFILMDRYDKLEEVKQVLPSTYHIDDLLELGKSRQDLIDMYAGLEIDEEEPTAIYYTSGTTSQSKGVLLSTKNIIANTRTGASSIPIPTPARSLSVLPIHHTFEATVGMYCLWAEGITICINDSLRNFAKNLKEWDITMMLGVPLIFTRLQSQVLKAIDKQGKTKSFHFARKLSRFLMAIGIDVRRKIFKNVLNGFAPKLRFVVNGAAALPVETFEFFYDLGVAPLSGYGLTETSPMLASCVPAVNVKGSVGRPLGNVTVAIDNGEGGNSPETAGEILAKGDNIMVGYYENDEATKEAFTEDGWFKTGDVGYFDKDHVLFITGRAKSMIVLDNGKKVFPEELELFFSEIPGIKSVMIWAETNERGLMELAVRLQIDADNLPAGIDAKDDAAIEKWLGQEVAEINEKMTEYKRVRHYIWNDLDPIMTTTMKVKRTPEIQRIHDYLEKNQVALRDVSGKRMQYLQ